MRLSQVSIVLSFSHVSSQTIPGSNQKVVEEALTETISEEDVVTGTMAVEDEAGGGETVGCEEGSKEGVGMKLDGETEAGIGAGEESGRLERGAEETL